MGIINFLIDIDAQLASFQNQVEVLNDFTKYHHSENLVYDDEGRLCFENQR